MSKIDKYKKLDDVEHVLVRKNMYIGSTVPNTSNKYLVENGKMIEREVTFNPGFQKIFDEIITNSVDESRREGSNLTVIKVSIDRDKNTISIWDNGGIPVEMNSDGDELIPQMIFGNLRAGVNFDDNEKRSWAGTNGVGSTLTNIFSTIFNVSTCDGKTLFKQTYKDNMSYRSEPKLKESTKNHTEISYVPDLERFGMSEIDDDNYKMMEKRVYDLAATNTKIKMYFQGELINFKSFNDYIKTYNTESVFFEEDRNWSMGIGLSEDGFKQVSFVNANETYDGGTHVDYITNQIVVHIREFINKKHKVDLKPSEIKSHLFIFLNAVVHNPSFQSQTKEKLISEIKDFGFTYEVSKKTLNGILKSEIIDSLLDWVKQKLDAESSKKERELNKQLSKTKVKKLIDAQEKVDRLKCSLCIFEGDSASGAFRKFSDSRYMGSYSLRGKFINTLKATKDKIMANEEAVGLMASLGLKLGQKPNLEELRYGKILLYVDADVDGNSIASQIINFLFQYWRPLFDIIEIHKVETPIVVATKGRDKNKDMKFLYNLTELEQFESKNTGYDIKYKKGLGALVDTEYKLIINEPQLLRITIDDDSEKSLNAWFGDEPELRKDLLM